MSPASSSASPKVCFHHHDPKRFISPSPFYSPWREEIDANIGAAFRSQTLNTVLFCPLVGWMSWYLTQWLSNCISKAEGSAWKGPPDHHGSVWNETNTGIWKKVPAEPRRGEIPIILSTIWLRTLTTLVKSTKSPCQNWVQNSPGSLSQFLYTSIFCIADILPLHRQC